MTEKIYVTRAQKLAAKSIVARSAKTGKAVRSSVGKIADAVSRTSTKSMKPQAGKS